MKKLGNHVTIDKQNDAIQQEFHKHHPKPRILLLISKTLCLFFLRSGEAAHFGKACFDGREVKFVVRECLPEDAGAYTCLVENSAGKTSCSAAVCVRGEQNTILKTIYKSIAHEFILFLHSLHQM